MKINPRFVKNYSRPATLWLLSWVGLSVMIYPTLAQRTSPQAEYVQFKDKYGPIHPRVKKLFEAFCRCGDLHFGFVRLRCPRCGENQLVPFSCKARGLCPSCGMRRAIAWAERMVTEVLPDVPYAFIKFSPALSLPGFNWSIRPSGQFPRCPSRPGFLPA